MNTRIISLFKPVLLRFLLTAGVLFSSAAAADSLYTIVSIKPLHSLVQAVLGDSDSAQLIINTTASPHSYAIKPSQVREVHQADIVFYVHPELEGFLPPVLESADDVYAVAVATLAGVHLLPASSEHGGHDEHDDHDEHRGHDEHDDHDEHRGHDEHDDHDEHRGHDEHDEHDEHRGHDEHDEHKHGEHDVHIWLDIGNAKVIVQNVVDILSERAPENAALYQRNAQAYIQRLAALDHQLETQLVPVRQKQYLVSHDAYQYFTRRYHLQPANPLLVSPHTPPSAKRLTDIRRRISALDINCIFHEPQFPIATAKAVADDDIRMSELDPLGSGLAAGEDLYINLLQHLADTMHSCLIADE